MHEFDERQVWLRGKAFKHSFIILTCFVFFDSVYAISTNDTHVFGAMSGFVYIMITVMVGSIETIQKGAYEVRPMHIRRSKWFGFIYLMIILLLIGFCSYEIISGQVAIDTLEGREDIGKMMIGSCLAIIGVYYQIHTSRNQNEEGQHE